MIDRPKKMDTYDDLIKTFADRCKGNIYHYTSSQGLRGIIENNEIWLTNTEFVNDTTECKALQKEKRLFNSNDFGNRYVRKAWKEFLDYPDTFPNDASDHYIVSFSKQPNLLSQYRAYGNFCIGFEAKSLTRYPFNLYSCAYNNTDIKNWILKKEKTGEWNSDNLEDKYKDAAAYRLIYIASRKFKNRHFHDEREVRLMTVSSHTWGLDNKSPSMFEKEPPIHYRDHIKYKMPVPYVKFMITDRRPGGTATETEREMKERKLRGEENAEKRLLPVKEVWIGPMSHQEEEKIACEIFLKDKGYKDVKVNVSDIPYRGK